METVFELGTGGEREEIITPMTILCYQETTKREEKKKEKDQCKSAQFMEDSDEKYGDIEVFLEKEKAQREKV